MFYDRISFIVNSSSFSMPVIVYYDVFLLMFMRKAIFRRNTSAAGRDKCFPNRVFVLPIRLSSSVYNRGISFG